MMIKVLEERDFPVSEFFPLASTRSAGKRVTFRGKSYAVIDVDKFDFSKAAERLNLRRLRRRRCHRDHFRAGYKYARQH